MFLKSKKEKKAEFAKSSLEVFETLAEAYKTLAVPALDTATKQKAYPYVKNLYDYVEDLYDDLMEVNVLHFKVNFIVIPLILLCALIIWFYVAGGLFTILYSLFSIPHFSMDPVSILAFFVAHHGIVIGLGLGVLYIVGVFFSLFASWRITLFLFDPIISAYVSFFDRLRDTRYPVASLVDKLIWLLYDAEQYHMQERLGFYVWPLVTVVEKWKMNSKQKTDIIPTGL